MSTPSAPEPVVLTTGHEIADTVAAAFARGANAPSMPVVNWPSTLAPNALPVFYGILRGTGEVARARVAAGLPWVYIDRGYTGAEHYSGTYRVVLNGLHWRASELPAIRPEWLGRQPLFRGWERSTERKLIVVTRPSGASAAWHGFDPDEWVMEVCRSLRGPRPVLITRKGDGYGPATLRRAHALVTHSSNLAVDALDCGVPSFVLGQHPLAGLSNTSLTSIEQPYYATADAVWTLAARMFSTQWTLKEMLSGACWDWLKSLLGDDKSSAPYAA